MKKFLLSIFLLSANFLLGQVLYSNAEDPEFIAMLKNGVTFIPSGNLERSAAIYTALEKNWKVSSVKDYDSEVELGPDEIVILETTFTVSTSTTSISEELLIWVRFGDLEKDQKMQRYSALGHVSLSGFTDNARDASITGFWDLAISGFNDVVELVKNENIIKKKSKMSAEISDKIFPKVKALQTKTLLFHINISQYVDKKALDKYKIQYKMLTTEEFDDLTDAERAQSCLLYYAKNIYTDTSIFDLSTNELIYTKRFFNAKQRLTENDISQISASWTQP